MMFPLVKQMAESPEPGHIRVWVSVASRVLGFTKQAYYKWRAKPESDREIEEAALVADIVQVHGDDPQFGYRLIADELRDLGWQVSERRVWRLCHVNQVFSTAHHAKRRKGSFVRYPAGDDLVCRDFTALAPNKVWVTDITEHKTGEGKLYLCAVKDLCGNRIVGWSIDRHMRASLAVAALEDAWLRRGKPAGVIVHSDRGSQFGSKQFIRACRQFGLVRSMGQAHTCADNAAMESFFALLQKNVLNQRKHWPTRAELRFQIVRWIEVTYNRRRRQRRLGRLTPIEYEIVHAPNLRLAA